MGKDQRTQKHGLDVRAKRKQKKAEREKASESGWLALSTLDEFERFKKEK